MNDLHGGVELPHTDQSAPTSHSTAHESTPSRRPVQYEGIGGLIATVHMQLRARGMRLTRPRIDMITALATAPAPLSSEALHERMGGRCDLVTVYRSLGSLEELGVVRKLYAFDGIVLYALALAEATFPVMSRSGEGIGQLGFDIGNEMATAVGKAVAHLEDQGFRNVRSVVQFFADGRS